MFERFRQPLLPRGRFIRRLSRNAVISAGLILGSLFLGASGYHHFEKLPWVDSIENAAMILTGMGPVDAVKTTAGKLFASAYALFSGVVFLTVATVALAPVIHRFLHQLHLDSDDIERDGPS